MTADPEQNTLYNLDYVQLSATMRGDPSSNFPNNPPSLNEKIAGAFAEIYRGIYPYMTEKTRGMIKDFVLKDPTTYESTGEKSRVAAARKLAHRIVDKHYNNIQNPGPLLPRESFIGDVLANELAPDRKRIAGALRSVVEDGELVLDPRKEALLLAKQLQKIPYINVPSFDDREATNDLKNEVRATQRNLIKSFNDWVNTAAQVTISSKRIR